MINKKIRKTCKLFCFILISKRENQKSQKQPSNLFLTKIRSVFSQEINSLFIPVHSFILIFSLSAINNVSAEERFRRHFIIAYDVSSPFKRAEKSNYDYRNAVISLFNNSEVKNYSEGNSTNLSNEKKNGLVFFDSKRDEISFFHFNIARSEFQDLRWMADNYNSKTIVTEFCLTFLKDKHIYWSDFKDKSVADYFKKALSISPNPYYFNSGVSLSNFVYPLILSRMDESKFSEEYILVILSDFLTGSMHGNKLDFNRIKDIYEYSYTGELPKNSAPAVIKSFADKLSSAYFKIDYFEFAFDQTVTQKPISIIGYKVKPKAGNFNPEDVAIFIDSDIELIQRGYKSAKYRIPESYLRFTHNDNVEPVEVDLKISIPHNGSSTILFSAPIAKLNAEKKWISEYSSDDDLMRFDKVKSLYFVPELYVNLDTLINKKQFDFINYEYKVNTSYSLDGASSLNYIYSAERLLKKNNVIFSTKIAIIIMYYIIPIILILIIIVYLVALGKPKGMEFTVHGYLDSLQTINYKKDGKLLTPYKNWDTQSDSIVVDGTLFYKNQYSILHWKPEIFFNITKLHVPDGFELFLKPNNNTTKEYNKDNPMPLRADRNNKIKFFVGIRQNDINLKINEPLQVSFKIEASILETKFKFIKADIRKTIDYKFLIGDVLGDVWVAFDPGTTGSCVAIGNHSENIILSEDKYGVKITESALAFDITRDYNGENGEIPEELYQYGAVAESKADDIKVKYFKSIKKLLGYTDEKHITFKNFRRLKLSGKELSSLLVKGLYKDLSNFIHKINNPEYLQNTKFNPKRAVVAIPNNFTISKIQDMVDCVGYLKQFKEIRYVYEAEAVMFYYLSNYSKFNNGKYFSNNENILIFDMGGATINATVVSASEKNESNKTVYYVDFLGKIGYGIGGDSIDFCLIKFLLSFSDEYLGLKKYENNIENHRQKLSNYAKKLKIEIVNGFKNVNNNFLITYGVLQELINRELDLKVDIKQDSKIYQYFNKDSKKGTFKLFEHPLFVDNIYNNIRDAVNEVLDLSNNCKLDKVIFSGRSTIFPYIKETVKTQLKSRKSSYDNVIELEFEESKTAVALGACWYGVNKNSIRLNNHKTNASFGIKQAQSIDKTDIKYIELVKMGEPFNLNNSKTHGIVGNEIISDDFSLDGAKVNFYQVMASDANQVLAKNQKHKYSKITSIEIDQNTETVEMVVKPDDDIECKVTLVTGKEINAKGFVSDQEIADANAEHYTWIIK